jgi:dTDP-4-amino-4,6-dideoxygalactose transaminase
MEIPLVDLKAQYRLIKEEVDSALKRVLEDGQFILGQEVSALEKEVASYCGVNYAVGVASGTDALHLALLACGIKPGDEVITTPFTFIATAEAVTRCGATPVFVDIDPRTYNVDPSQIEPRVTKKTKAIIPVHLYGQPAEMEPILELALEHDFRIIEDCAQALGAEYKGRKAGSLGDAGCLSFFPSKNLGAYGDGGMVVTNSSEIAEKVEMLRNHGCREKYYHLLSGFNSRLDTLQAAILRVKLRHLNDWIKLRHEKASFYAQFLAKEVGLPHIVPNGYHAFNYYTIRLRNSRSRDNIQRHLSSQGIATAIYYPLSLHLQEVFKSLGYKPGDFPESERAQEEVLSLPIYPELSENQIEEVTKAINVEMQS